MPSVLDRVNPAALAEAAEIVRNSYDIPGMPEMSLFNSSPCSEHAPENPDPNPYCRACGIKLRRHQRVAVMWLWLVKRGLIADPVGSGKTHVITGLFALLFETGELSRPRGGGRALVVCEPTAMRQWQREIRRAVPGLITELAEGSQRKRADRYAEPWDVLIIGHQMARQDYYQLQELGISTLVMDDVDPLRHSETKTAHALKKLGIENNSCDRIILLNATPLHKKLLELYDSLSQIGGSALHRLGPRTEFERRHIRKEPVDYWVNGPRGRPVKRTKMETTGIRRLPEFREKIAPMVLRRSLAQIDDVELPEIVPSNIFLELHPLQREKYRELQQGVLEMVRNGENQRINALNKLLYGKQICEGLSVIGDPDGPGKSVKFDWLLDRLTGDWAGESEDDAGEKVVVFIQYKNGLRSLAHRMESEGLGYEVIWGEERRGAVRDAALERFREDPSCRVLLGTSAIEKSLNLQVARHLVNVDQLPNPARMQQLAGRVRRQGSRFQAVYVHNLLTTDTHEERALAMLETEAALASAVWEEESDLFRTLSPAEISALIAPQALNRRVA
ncbi:MAG: DEAD/DEAH box helicase [Candidatus Nanopelagicales bacterium]